MAFPGFATTTSAHVRPASSVYSNPFELERLLSSDLGCDEQTVQMLTIKRDKLLEEVRVARSEWEAIYRVVQTAAEKSGRLLRICESAQRRMVLERNKWLANCTAI